MAIWLVWKRRESTPPYLNYWGARDVSAEPSPTVTATGIGAAAKHHAFLVEAREDPGVPEQRTLHEDLNPRPPYKRPTLKAIRRRKRNGLTVVSTFSSSGGSTTGYLGAGFSVLAAVEFIPEAAKSYRANHPTTNLLERDIREVTAQDLLDAAGLKKGELDVLDGSPPCEPFSSAGKREAGWGKENAYSGTFQRSDDLFFEYARLVEGIQPRTFVAENVKGLVLGKARGYYREILRRLKACGYRVEARVLDAQWLGVPQHRERVIFIGVREDLERDPVFPHPLPYRFTMRDACPHLGSAEGLVATRNGHGFIDRDLDVDEPAPTVMAQGGDPTRSSLKVVDNGGTGFSERALSLDEPAPTVIARGSNGNGPTVVHDNRSPGGQSSLRDRLDEPAPTITTRNKDHLHVHGEVEQVVGNEGFEPKFGSPDQPHPTITASGARTSGEIKVGGHRRMFTIEELKSICGFPPDYVLTGSFGKQWERLGDAVPPPMMEAIARSLRDEVLLPSRKK